MADIAILTPDPWETSYPDLWPKVLSRLQRALERLGIAATPTRRMIGIPALVGRDCEVDVWSDRPRCVPARRYPAGLV